MGYYGIVNNIPIDITFNGAGSKNNEVNRAQEWIKNNDIKKYNICMRSFIF
jgi:hypothetical protein